MSTRRISILGIDGSGKTTLMSQLAEKRAELGISVMFCPDFHLLEDLPCAPESRLGKQLSLLADEIGSPRLKYLALYVRMKLFGPVEALQSRGPVLFQERHAVIDGLVYSQLYAPAVLAESFDPQKLHALKRGFLSRFGEWDGSALLRRFESMAEHLPYWLDEPPSTWEATFSREFSTRRPDQVVFLDVSPARASERLRGARALEMHEDPRSLVALRSAYLRQLSQLEMPVVHLPVEDDAPGAVLERVLAATGVGAP